MPGKNKKHNVFLYTLSTCGWCKKTKQLLRDNDVEFEYLDVDTSHVEERRKTQEYLASKGIPLMFPIMIVNDEKVIVGYKESEIREALEI